jgi:hypothetical protein
VKQRAVELYRQKKQAKLWHDYGPTLAVEELAAQHGIAISRESLRWCSGTQVNTIGWKDAAKSCT